MEELIETIKLAVADEATSEAKQAGAGACRTLLAALDAEPGAALVAPAAVASNPLAGMDLTQVLDLVIAKLRSAVDDDRTEFDRQRGYQVQLVGVPGRK